MQSIQDVFSDLDRRIDYLKHGIAIVEIGVPSASEEKDFCNEEKIISKIERNIILFKKESIPRIEISLKELNKIDALGMSIIKSASYFHEVDKENDDLRHEAYRNIKAELKFYINKLEELKNFLGKEEPSEKVKYNINLPDDFTFPEIRPLNPQIDISLTREQEALLFHYLIERNIILSYDVKHICKIISILTGYSAESLRQKDFGKIHDLKNKIPQQSKRSVNSNTNLEILKEALLGIIQEIDNEIKDTPKRK